MPAFCCKRATSPQRCYKIWGCPTQSGVLLRHFKTQDGLAARKRSKPSFLFPALAIFHDLAHPDGVVQNLLAHPQVLRRDLQQLVICQIFQALL